MFHDSQPAHIRTYSGSPALTIASNSSSIPILKLGQSATDSSKKLQSKCNSRSSMKRGNLDDSDKKLDRKTRSDKAETQVTGSKTAERKKKIKEQRSKNTNQSSLQRINKLLCYGITIGVLGLFATTFTAAMQIPSRDAYSTDADKEARTYSPAIDIVNWAGLLANTYCIRYAYNGNGRARTSRRSPIASGARTPSPQRRTRGGGNA